MAFEKKVLFRGTNNLQEFWEAEDHGWVFLRLHREATWSIHLNYRFKFFADSPQEAAKQVGVELSTDRVWKSQAGGTTKLVAVAN
jgi:hypothetical protein